MSLLGAGKMIVVFCTIVCATSLLPALLAVPIDAGLSNRLAIQVNVNEVKECCSKEINYPLTPIYCYGGNNKTILSVFQTIMVDLIIDNTDDFIVYKAFDQHLVKKKIADTEETFFNQRLSYFLKLQGFELDPFQPFCFSIKTNANYKIRIHSIALHSRRLAMFLVGIFLFAYSARLSYYSFIYYLCGVINSIFFTIIILHFISQLIPKEKCIVGFLEDSCTLSLHDMQMMIENINIISNYIYVCILFLLLICVDVYYKYTQSSQNLKSTNFIKWTLQLIGLTLVTFCSFHFEAMIFIDILSIVSYYSKFSLPFALLPKTKKRLKIRYLSEDEYIQQAKIETPKALKELHKYCNSPNSDIWKVLSRLRSYKRFIMFMITSDHHINIKISEMETDNEFGDVTESETDSHNSSICGIENIEYFLTSDDE